MTQYGGMIERRHEEISQNWADVQREGEGEDKHTGECLERSEGCLCMDW